MRANTIESNKGNNSFFAFGQFFCIVCPISEPKMVTGTRPFWNSWLLTCILASKGAAFSNSCGGLSHSSLTIKSMFSIVVTIPFMPR